MAIRSLSSKGNKAWKTNYNKAYRLTHLEQERARWRRYYEENREYEIARNRQWVIDNREHRRQYEREWKAKNPDKLKLYREKLKAKLKTFQANLMGGL